MRTKTGSGIAVLRLLGCVVVCVAMMSGGPVSIAVDAQGKESKNLAVPFSFNGDTSELLSQDWEVDSGDWTHVSVQYSTAINGNELFLFVTMEVKEGEKNQTFNGKTHIRTTGKQVLHKETRPGFRILSVSAGREHYFAGWFQGEKHGLVTMQAPNDNGGGLLNPRVRFDGPTKDDRSVQLIEGTWTGTIVLQGPAPAAATPGFSVAPIGMRVGDASGAGTYGVSTVVPRIDSQPGAPAAPAVNPVDAAETALHRAAGTGRMEELQHALGTPGIDVDAKNPSGKTALQMAVEHDQYECAKALVARGASLDAVAYAVEQSGNEERFHAMATQLGVVPDAQLFESAVAGNRLLNAEWMLMSSSGLDKNQALETILRLDRPLMIPAALDAGAAPGPALQYAVKKRDVELASTIITGHGASASEALLPAVQQKDEQMTRALLPLMGGAAIPGETMSAAGASGSVVIVRELVASGGSGALALDGAMSKGHTEIARFLVGPEGQVTPRPEHVQAAAQLDNAGLVDVLLDAGAPGDPGMLPAIQKKNLTIVRALMTRGSSKADGARPEYVEAAAKANSTPILALLLEAGAPGDPGMLPAINHKNEEAVRMLLRAGTPANGTNPAYLGAAGGQGLSEAVRDLLGAGADPASGMKPAVKGNHAGVVGLLLEAGAAATDPDLIKTAAGNGSEKVVGMLLDRGAPAQAGLEPAIRSTSAKVVERVLEGGADGSGPDHVLLAAKVATSATVEALLDAGADKDAADGKGWTLMHFAAQRKLPDMVQVLATAGAPVNEANAAGDAPIHLAANVKKDEKKDPSTVLALIQAGANVNLPNAAGQLPRKIASGKVEDAIKQAGGKK